MQATYCLRRSDYLRDYIAGDLVVAFPLVALPPMPLFNTEALPLAR